MMNMAFLGERALSAGVHPARAAKRIGRKSVQKNEHTLVFAAFATVIGQLILVFVFMTSFLLNILGWAGAATYIVAYILLSAGWMNAGQVRYHALNAIGGLLLVIFSYAVHDQPNLFVNLIWILIAAASSWRILVLRRRRRT
jgi:hypothetical protein